ncbi:Kinesin-like protein KIF19 [Bienertia sinuspersici]
MKQPMKSTVAAIFLVLLLRKGQKEQKQEYAEVQVTSSREYALAAATVNPFATAKVSLAEVVRVFVEDAFATHLALNYAMHYASSIDGS